jgi:hypothetical protein
MPDLLIGLTQMMVEGELLQLERIGRIDVTGPTAWNWWIANRLPVQRLRCLGAWRDTRTRRPRKSLANTPESGHYLPTGGRRLDFTAREKTRQAGGGDLREGKVTPHWCTP